MFMAHVCFSVQSQGQLRKSIKSISRRDTNVWDWIGLSTRLNRFINKLNTASYWLLLRMNWAQANKYGYHLHIDCGIVVTDPFRSNLSTTMSSAIVSEGQHIVNVSFRDHFSLVLCYYWVVWISHDCWFFPLWQHGFFRLNSKLHLGLVFKIGFCFIEEWILDKKRYLWYVFGLFVFQGIQLFVKDWLGTHGTCTWGSAMFGALSPTLNQMRMFFTVWINYFKNKFGRAKGSLGLITYNTNKYSSLSKEFYRGLMERTDGNRTGGWWFKSW